MIEPCWYKLNISFNEALRPDWSLPDPAGEELKVWHFRATEMFREEWIKSMHEQGIYVAECLIFYRAPNFHTGNAHIDIHRDHPKRISTFALNWVLKGKGSEMTWFRTPKVIPPLQGAGAVTYLSWPEKELEEIDRGPIEGDNLTLVRIGVPHNVIVRDEERYCISIRAGTIEKMYWKDIVKFMKDKNLLIER